MTSTDAAFTEPREAPQKLTLVARICRDVGLAVVARELDLLQGLEQDLDAAVRRGSRYFVLMPREPELADLPA